VPLSVVVPTYHRPEKLSRALAAIERLQPAPVEVLVVVHDPDDAPARLPAGGRVVFSPAKGAGAQRNAGWREATSDLIAFTDDDCVVDPAWAGELAAGFRTPAIGVVQGRTVPLGPTGPLSRTITIERASGLFESCNIAYRRAALEAAGGFDPGFSDRFGGRPFGEDADLGWRVTRAGWASAFSPAARVSHEVEEGSLRDVAAEEWRRGMFPVLIKLLPELRQQMPWGGWALRRQSPWAQMALAGLLLGPVAPGPGLALFLPYLAWLRGIQPRRQIPYQAYRDLVGSVALIVGSVRAGRMVL